MLLFLRSKEQHMGQSTSLSSSAVNIQGHIDSNSDGPGPYIMGADTLTGDEVYNRQEEHLGEIKTIMLDVPSGRIAYAVLAAGGFLGMGKRLFAIPWSALTLDVDKECFVLDANKERLENAPGFDDDNWPSMADSTWATDVHDYYKQEPYWR
jgi:sporulation protein YlmC with PRC-barrel domain